MPNIAIATLVGYGAAVSGGLLGAWLSGLLKKERPLHILMGGSAGLLTAFICFEMLPPVLTRWGLYRGLAGMLAGIVFAVTLENIFKGNEKETAPIKTQARATRRGSVLAAGLALHYIPEGMALGALLKTSFPAGLCMAAVITAHCLPEALMVLIPLRQEGAPLNRRLAWAAALALPMAAGTAAGFTFGGLSALLADTCLTFAAGMMLYIACAEILPDAGLRGTSWPAAIGAAAGFIAGVFLTARL